MRVRAFNHVGPGQDPRFVLPSVARQIAQAEHDGRERVEVRVGNVDTRRDFTDVRDMVRAYTGCCSSAATPTPSTWPAAAARGRCAS